jgi:hypothetical protein
VLGLASVTGLTVDATLVSQAGLQAYAPLTKRLGATAWVGGVRLPNGDLNALDAWIAAPIRVVDKPEFVLRLAPALSLPLGGGARGVTSSQGSGSLDPAAQIDAVGGGAWVGIGLAQARVPVVAGRDEVRDGVSLRADAKVGRRLDGWIPSVGLSVLHQSPDADDNRGFDELAAVAGAVVHLGDAWALEASARVPVTGGAEYWVAGQVGVTYVAGKSKD